jgi:hypothetical protein
MTPLALAIWVITIVAITRAQLVLLVHIMTSGDQQVARSVEWECIAQLGL